VRLRQVLQGVKNRCSRVQIAHSQFANDERVREHVIIVEQTGKDRIGASEVVNPN
jgi:hypothetical protein